MKRSAPSLVGLALACALALGCETSDTRELDVLCTLAGRLDAEGEAPELRLAVWGERATASVSSPAVREAVVAALGARPPDRWRTLLERAGRLGRDDWHCPALAELFEDARRAWSGRR